jgi:succinate-semialdehyde dehydrogenase/glutarate-semialdehyde dehydrogenase
VQKLKARTAALRIGDPALEETEMGPLCNPATLQRVVDHVEDARALGADIEQFGPQEGSSIRRRC